MIKNIISAIGINTSAKVLTLFLLLANCGCFSQKQLEKNSIHYTEIDWKKDSIVVANFIKIDSIVNSHKHRKSFYCPEIILKVLIAKTGISSTGDNTFVGPKFTISDWLNWHNWFINKFR